MKILVCVKQVPESDTTIKIDESGRWVRLEKSVSSKMNRFDEFAVEEALLIREAFPGTTVEIVSVGPEDSALVVKRALGMGADRGIHLQTARRGYLDPLATARRIASFARDKGYDLILAGVMSEDYMQGQVGPMTAEMLSLPCATSVIAEQLMPDRGVVRVEREKEGGYRDLLEIRLPAVLTVQSGINVPRYPSLTNVLRAKKEKLETIGEEAEERPEPMLEVYKVGYPERKRSGIHLEGTPEQKAKRLIEIFRRRSLIH